MRTNRENRKWLGRMAAILLTVGVAESLVGTFAPRPFPWVVLLAALVPVLTSFFVILPMMKYHRQATR